MVIYEVALVTTRYETGAKQSVHNFKDLNCQSRALRDLLLNCCIGIGKNIVSVLRLFGSTDLNW